MNPNPNFSTDFRGEFEFDFEPYSLMELELSDYLMLDDHKIQGSNFNQKEYSPSSQSVISSEKYLLDGSSTNATSKRRNNNIKCKNNGEKRNKMEVGHKVAFRTQSEREVMDDGFKWRKYGKKSVKNSPNPRNYFKCSSGGCNVKKRIERDKNDSSYVITTYEGVHNHESPGVVYCDQMSSANIPNLLALQDFS